MSASKSVLSLSVPDFILGTLPLRWGNVEVGVKLNSNTLMFEAGGDKLP